MGSSIDGDMLTYLKSVAGVTSYVGAGASARIYWTAKPDSMPTMPYIVYYTVAVDGTRLYLADVTPQVLFQFSVFHTHPQNGLDLAGNVFDALDGYHGTPGAKKIHYISAMGPRVIKDPDFDNVVQYIVDATVEYSK